MSRIFCLIILLAQGYYVFALQDMSSVGNSDVSQKLGDHWDQSPQGMEFFEKKIKAAGEHQRAGAGLVDRCASCGKKFWMLRQRWGRSGTLCLRK